MFYSKSLLHKLIEFIHINVGKKLRREIPERDAFSGSPMKALNDIGEQTKKSFVFNAISQNLHQLRMIDAGKELSYITLQNPTGPRVISAHLSCNHLETIDRCV